MHLNAEIMVGKLEGIDCIARANTKATMKAIVSPRFIETRVNNNSKFFSSNIIVHIDTEELKKESDSCSVSSS